MGQRGRPPTHALFSVGVVRDGHLGKMGGSQSLFWWSVANQTPYPHKSAGWVRGKEPITREEIAGDLGVSLDTVSRFRKKQDGLGYLAFEDHRRGWIIRVLKQKKFVGPASAKTTRQNPRSGSAGTTRQNPKSLRSSAEATTSSLPVSAEAPPQKPRPSPYRVNIIDNTTSELTLTEQRPPRRPGRKRSGPPFELLQQFGAHHQRVVRTTDGEPVKYRASFARDQKLLADLLMVHDQPMLEEMLEAFWSAVSEYRADPESKDNWIGRARLDIPGFVRQVPNLLAHYKFGGKRKCRRN